MDHRYTSKALWWFSFISFYTDQPLHFTYLGRYLPRCKRMLCQLMSRLLTNMASVSLLLMACCTSPEASSFLITCCKASDGGTERHFGEEVLFRKKSVELLSEEDPMKGSWVSTHSGLDCTFSSTNWPHTISTGWILSMNHSLQAHPSYNHMPPWATEVGYHRAWRPWLHDHERE